MLISARSVENCISVEILSSLNTAYSPFCKTSINLQPAKQGLFSLIPEAAVHMNFDVNVAELFRIPFCIPYDDQIQNRCSRKSRKILEKTTMLESLFSKAAGLRFANF